MAKVKAAPNRQIETALHSVTVATADQLEAQREDLLTRLAFVRNERQQALQNAIDAELEGLSANGHKETMLQKSAEVEILAATLKEVETKLGVVRDSERAAGVERSRKAVVEGVVSLCQRMERVDAILDEFEPLVASIRQDIRRLTVDGQQAGIALPVRLIDMSALRWRVQSALAPFPWSDPLPQSKLRNVRVSDAARQLLDTLRIEDNSNV